MENLEKLKAILAKGVREHKLYEDGLKAVSLLDGLVNEEKSLNKSIKALSYEYSEEEKRIDSARREAERIEDENCAQSIEIGTELKNKKDTLQETLDLMTKSTNDKLKIIEEKTRVFIKFLKENENKAVEAESRLQKAEEQLADVRSRLKSI